MGGYNLIPGPGSGGYPIQGPGRGVSLGCAAVPPQLGGAMGYPPAEAAIAYQRVAMQTVGSAASCIHTGGLSCLSMYRSAIKHDPKGLSNASTEFSTEI